MKRLFGAVLLILMVSIATKPTSEGASLGLFLSYDIVTKGHEGELKVKTK